MEKHIFTIFFLIWFSLMASAQVSVNTDNSPADPSAALQIKFADKGFLPPRMTHAGMDSIENPATGLLVYCTDCGTGGTGCLAVFRNGGWYCTEEECVRPSAPVQGTHSTSGTEIIWNWNTVAGATGYKWGTTGSYGSATDMGAATSKTESGLQCNTAYTRYIWAYNGCGRSDSTILSATTPSCAWTCGQPVTDNRDSKIYGTALIGNQCWLSQNLNTGTRIEDNTDQSNNPTIEKYCYNNTESNCTTYGGLYQWAETVQYLNGATNTTSWSPAPTGNVQGICPDGWHIPAYSDWYALVSGLDPDAGGKMKEAGLTHWADPNTGATNSSGFTGLPGGLRLYGGGFGFLTTDGGFRGLDEFVLTDHAMVVFLSHQSTTASLTFNLKAVGASVRCIKND